LPRSLLSFPTRRSSDLVDDAGLDVDLGNVADEFGESVRDLHSAQWNSGKHDRFQVGVLLDNFVGDPPQRAPDRFRVHDRGTRGPSRTGNMFFVVHLHPWRPRRIALKEPKINQEAAFSVRASFIRRSRQWERCFTIQSRSAFSKPMSLPAFSLSIHLCFKISSRSARNSL